VLLGLVAATLPLAAVGGDDAARAIAATALPPPPVPAPPPPAPPAPTEARVQWRDSIAHGSANSGWLERGVILPEEGPGFYTYDPRTQTPPNSASRRHGTAMLVRQIIALGRWWEETFPESPRLGIGDLSHEGGGSFDLHASHENGLDVDIRMPRADAREGRVGPDTYDRRRSQALVDRLVAQGAQYVLKGGSIDVRGPGGIVMYWPNHEDHFHVRFPDPDGLGN
jgi:murein endopeptidase